MFAMVGVVSLRSLTNSCWMDFWGRKCHWDTFFSGYFGFRFSPVILLLLLGKAGEAGETSNKTVLRWMLENIEQTSTFSIPCYTVSFSYSLPIDDSINPSVPPYPGTQENVPCPSNRKIVFPSAFSSKHAMEVLLGILKSKRY